jgi:hypothetical protein
MYLFLSESPTHVIDAVRKLVGQNDFSPATALLFLDIYTYIAKMEGFTDEVRRNIALSPASDTLKAMKVIQSSIPEEERSRMIASFEEKSKHKILSDLDRIEKKLLKIYDESDVQVHQDK